MIAEPISLRPHQAKLLNGVRQALLSGCKRPMCELPTGGGKTRVAARMVQGALDKGKRTLFIAPAIELIGQTVESFQDLGIHQIGVIQADHELTDPDQPVQVASVQTLMRRKGIKADLVIIDEAHRQFDFLRRLMHDPEWAHVPMIGLSATPWSRGLGKDFDALVKSATTEELIRDGWLAPFRVFAPSSPDLSDVSVRGGDYVEAEASEAMQEGTLTADIVTTWLQLGEQRPTLCFAVDRAHAAALSKEFEAAEVSTGYIDCHTDAAERKRVREAFASGEIKVVCNVGVLTTGVDWDVRCIILARPTKSEILYTQIIGRGLRPAEGKADCLILDHSDTTLRLGFVTDIGSDALDTGNPAARKEKERNEPLPKECPTCHYVRAPKIHACPACGFAPERQDAVEVVDGDLVELVTRTAAKANKAVSWDEKVFFFAQLKRYAAEQGYKSGWAAMKYRDKFGVWPNDWRVKDVRPSGYVTQTVRSWIRSRNIAFAKAKKREAA